MVHFAREGNTRSQFVFFSQLAKNDGYELDGEAFKPGGPLRDEFVWARFHSQATGTSERLAGVLDRGIREVVAPSSIASPVTRDRAIVDRAKEGVETRELRLSDVGSRCVETAAAVARSTSYKHSVAGTGSNEWGGAVMAEHILGYARVSTRDQNPAQQEAALKAAGAERIFVDHGESSRKVSRPQWDACPDHLRQGDVLLVYRLDRLSGSDQHLIALIHELRERGVDLRSLTEPAIDTTSPIGRALYGIMAVFAQLRLDTIRQNTLDGLAHARSKGRFGGRPTVMTPEKIEQALAMRADKKTIAYIAGVLGVREATVKRALQKERDREQLQKMA